MTSHLQSLLTDKEVLDIVQNASKSENVTIINWSLKEKDGELTGFLGVYLKLRTEAIIVRIIEVVLKRALHIVSCLNRMARKFPSIFL